MLRWRGHQRTLHDDGRVESWVFTAANERYVERKPLPEWVGRILPGLRSR